MPPDLDLVAGFDWDRGNTRKNERHGVSMREAEQVFMNEPLLLLDDGAHSSEEARYHALGVTDEGRPLHVSFTLRAGGTKIRVISARTMHWKERRVYAEGQIS